ncbi:ABC transporter permease [Pelagimonas varians]|jgi:peptide/nickel transport system permease protein|uniref:Glutathione transport system permease protein GsiC n=1 Tax=Pelagimonas varians TaxID=696760 RepID=A0A238KJ15_9RHOB|nr:ABC transporter permease [Pelagimonas varians]MDB9857497.1 ABC transporter permease [Amylibacter sp.]PYG32278.1 peptide/nickel transport system permease protein [Pelagimonas varians]SMX42056.1 Glutathione transport system permease protein GsiC [Pelagimonas varians]|tara:strand:+ start:144 stop:1115 length:972 start_codon:yes stop_codon:yes gene_type:complete
MIAFVIRRIIQSIIVIMVVGLVAFVMFRFVGDPVNQMVGLETSIADRELLREQLGLNQPLIVQYWHFISNAAQGDFGTSYQYRRPVSEILGERLPATLELALVSAIFAIAAGIPMGVYTALYRDSVLSNIFLTVSLIGISLPSFLVGILLIFIFSVHLQWLPSFGRGEVVDLGWWSTGLLTATGLKAIILPAITLGLFQMTLIMRLVRSEMMEVLRTDFVKFAKARGLKTRVVHFGHALKNTMIPVITITGLQFGSIIAFAIITETVFQWPGSGLLFLQAVQNVDVPIMAAYLLMIAFLFVLINLIVDVLYVVVDPRIRLEGS